MTSVGSELGRAALQLPYLPRALRLVWDAAGGWTIAWIALLVVQGLLPLAMVWLTRSLVDGRPGGRDPRGRLVGSAPACGLVHRPDGCRAGRR